MRHSASFLGILMPTTRCCKSLQGGRTRTLVGGRLLTAIRLVVGEPPPEPAQELDDLPASLVADTTHQVDVADRVLQEVADGQDIRPLQGILGSGAQPQGGDGRVQIRLLQPDPEIDLLAAGCRDLALFRLLEDPLPRPAHLIGVVESLLRVSVQPLTEEPHEAVPDTRIDLLGVDHQLGIRHRRVGLAVAPLREHTRPEGHLVEGRRRRVPLGLQVPPLRLAIGEERVRVTGRADTDIIERGMRQGEIEQDQLVPALGQRADADVVGLDIPVGDPVAFQ